MQIRPPFVPQVPLLWLGQRGRVTYLQGSEEHAASQRNTDLIVVVDLPFAVGSKTMDLFENENQNRSCVQVLFNPVGSEGGERYSRKYLLIVIFVLFLLP